MEDPNAVVVESPETFALEEPTKTYWAADPDPEIFGSAVKERATKFVDHLRRTKLYNRICRNWKYYHNLFYSNSDDEREIRSLGEEGEYAGLAVNHLRNLLQHLLTLATQNPPVVDVLAINSDMRALSQAKLGKQLLEYYYQVRNVAEIYKQAVENALVFSAGYVKTTWDTRAGKALQANPLTGTIDFQGDLQYSAPGFFDVLYDWRQPNWEEHRWIAVRRMENRWDLAEKYPEKRNTILDYQDDNYEWNNFLRFDVIDDFEADLVPVWEFYHKKSDAIPLGRQAILMGDEVLEDGEILYEDLPVDRVVTGQFLGTCHGYTPGFDLQGLQEALNGEFSSILTNHESFGVQALWAPTASNVDAEEIKRHLLVLHSDQKPEAINFTSTPPEIFQFIAVIIMHMEYISGVNSVLRGQPEASLKSGRALALIAAQAIQFASPLIQSYTRLIEQNGTKALRILKTFADTPRIIALTGKHNVGLLKEFTGTTDLELIDCVKVQVGNAMSRTLAGRIEMADKLAEQGWLRNREEYFTVMTTGQLDSLIQAEEAQLRVVHEENELLMSGQAMHKASALDHHVLHIKEHHAILNSTQARQDPMLSTSVLAAVMEHMQMLWDPMMQEVQHVLGYETVVMPLPGMGQPMPGQEQGMGVGRPEAPKNPNRDMAMPEGSPEAQAAQMPSTPQVQAGP